MTAYHDIYSDLPSRVYEVWQRTKALKEPNQPDLSVTAMLMAAAAGLAMPFENLKDVGAGNGQKWTEHPMFYNVQPSSYQTALHNCDVFFKQPIRDCVGLGDALLMQCQKLKDIRKAAADEKGDAAMDTSKYDVRFALKILRNALAHNNILSISDSGEIEKLVFFSRSNWCPGSVGVEGSNVLIISVQSFNTFLEKWFELLRPVGGIQGAALAIGGEKTAKPPNGPGREK